MSRPQKCQHLKSDGTRCGSPALRNKRLCHFHHASRVQHPNRMGRPAILPELPVLEDARSIQLAYNQVAQALSHRAIDPRAAGQITCLLQLASANLENMER